MEQIGSGVYGVVYKANVRGKLVAVKKLKKRQHIFTNEEISNFMEEVTVMRASYHPNVVLLMGAWVDQGKSEVMLVTELYSTDLETLIIKKKSTRPLTLPKRLEMAKDAALGMNWLHCSKPQIIHRDLKLSNLLVDDKLQVKVADFGLTKVLSHDEKKY